MAEGLSLTRVFFALALPTLLVAALTLAGPYLVPIAVAVLIWFLINALADAIGRTLPGAPGWVAMGASVALLFLVILFVVQVIAANVATLGEGLIGVDDELIAAVNSAAAALGLDLRINLDAVLRGLRIEDLAREALGIARGLASDVALVFLYVMFLLIDQRFYVAKLRALVPDAARRERLRATLIRIAVETRTYLWLMSLISGGVGLATWLVCGLFGVNGAGFWGFLAFALNFIPTIGSIAGVALPSIYALLQLESGAAVLGLIAALSAVQFVAGEIVLPRLMGARLNLSSFVILLSLVVWGAMWGPAGMFLAIPIMVILMIVFAQFPATRPIAILLSKAGRLTSPVSTREEGTDSAALR